MTSLAKVALEGCVGVHEVRDSCGLIKTRQMGAHQTRPNRPQPRGLIPGTYSLRQIKHDVLAMMYDVLAMKY